MSCVAAIKPVAAPFTAAAKDVPPPSLCSHLTSPVSSAPASSISKIPSLSSSMSMSSTTPSPSVSNRSSVASRKSTSWANGVLPLPSLSTSGRAAAPKPSLSLTTKPSSTDVPFCASNTSNKPSPSASVAAEDWPVAAPVKPASTVSPAPSLSEFVSMISAKPSLSVSTGVTPFVPT